MSATFTFDSGQLCLDFLATLVDRDGAAIERFAAPEDLSDWIAAAGLSAQGLPATKRDLAAALDLREQAYRVVQAVRQGARPPKAAIDCLNEWAARRPAAPQLGADGRSVTWNAKNGLVAALSHVARDMIELLSGPQVVRLRLCSGPACSMLFIDTSRAGNRRWCSMERCGNRSKKAEFRRRQAAGKGSVRAARFR